MDIEKSKELNRKENYDSLFAALVNRLAKLEKINKDYFENKFNKIYVSYLLPCKKKLKTFSRI